MDAMEKRYAGKPFVFHTPFQCTPGWKDGDVGIIVRRFTKEQGDPVDEEIEDMWLAWNVESGEYHEIWGGEAYDDKKIPIVWEHRFTNWKPS